MTSGAFPTANRESAFTLSTSQTRPQPLQTPTRQWDLFCPPMVSGEPTDPILPDSDPFLPKGHPPPPHTRADFIDCGYIIHFPSFKISLGLVATQL